MYVHEGGRVNVSHCTFSENRGVEGGAMYVHVGGSANVMHSEFSQNQAQEQAGAIVVSGSLETDHCRFVANVGGLQPDSNLPCGSSGSGASALQVMGRGTAESRGDTFERNWGEFTGVSPAIYVYLGTMDLQGCTMSANEDMVNTCCQMQTLGIMCIMCIM